MKRYLLLAVIILSSAVGLAAGYFVGKRNSEGIESAMALNCFMDELAALSSLEKGDIPRVRERLRASIEGNIVTLDRIGSTPIDEQNPQAIGKLLSHYKSIRTKYGPIEFPDDGAMNRRVERILERGSL